jgi:hypothetical protein
MSDPIVLESFTTLRTDAGWLPNPDTPDTPVWQNEFGYGARSVSGNILTATLAAPDAGASKHQLYFLSVDNNGFFFIRRWVESGSWDFDGVNRMRFRVKVPDAFPNDETGGGHSIEFATFHHEGSSTDGPWLPSDVNNWHFYHFFDIPGDGLWWQCIVDTCPDHQRGEGGSVEQGDLEFLDSGNLAHTYFDMMTSFYWDYVTASSAGKTTQLKPFTMFYENNSTVPIRQVRSLSGAFDPETNTIKLHWNRRKDQPGHQYTVRYAFSPISTFSTATLAGTFNSPNTGSENGVYFEFTDAALASNAEVWVAIQPNGTSLFRQFSLELEGGGDGNALHESTFPATMEPQKRRVVISTW